MKQVRILTKPSGEWWVIMPDINIYSFVKRKQGITFLDIFYRFAQFLIKNATRKDLFKNTAIDLNNKIEQAKFFNKELAKQVQVIRNKQKKKRRIYDYKPYQKLLGLVEATLNTAHSLYEVVKRIDKILGTKEYENLEKERWFQFLMDLRNLCHHCESPTVSVERGKIILTFERLNQLRYPRMLHTLKIPKEGKLNVEVTTETHAYEDFFIYLQNWGQKYLEKIDTAQTIKLITGFKKDGTYKYKRVELKSLLKIAKVSKVEEMIDPAPSGAGHNKNPRK